MVAGALLALLSLTNVLLVAGGSVSLRGHPSPIYRDASEVAAMDWLAHHAGWEDVVLSTFGTGNYLPARAGVRVFVGHGPETVGAETKKELVARFFDGQTEDTWRQDLLARYGVDYVFWGPAERALGVFSPPDATYLEVVYRAEGYAILEVRGD